MATNAVYQKEATAISFQDASGTVVMAGNAIATINGVTSAEHDRGAALSATPVPTWFRWEATVRWQATPVVGEQLRIYARSYDTSALIYPAASQTAQTPETKFNNWQLVDAISCSLASSAQSFYKSGLIYLPGRYIMVGLWNGSTVATTATNNITTVTLIPIFEDIQAAA